MGQLSDTSVLIRHQTFLDIVAAAAMKLVEEVHAEPAETENHSNRLSYAQRIMQEVQGELKPSYLTRLQWLVAGDPAIRALNVVTKGVVATSVFDNDTAWMDSTRNMFKKVVALDATGVSA